MAISDLDGAEWLNEPPSWTLADGRLEMTTGPKTDFWQDTWYGFRRDDGHSSGAGPGRVYGNRRLRCGLRASLRPSRDHAANRCEELDQGRGRNVGRRDECLDSGDSDGLSDWSVVGRARTCGPQSVRITRRGDAALAQFLDGEAGWTLLRLCPFPDDARVMVGPMACSPQRAGFIARFTGFEVGPALEGLHG